MSHSMLLHLSAVTRHVASFFFFFNDTATTEIYTLSLHDALPIWRLTAAQRDCLNVYLHEFAREYVIAGDRKSTRLNSSHPSISYAVFCLKKKKSNQYNQ